MKPIYLFSGLGADKRVFEELDFSEYNPTFIQWIQPIENETIEHYAQRISEQIKTPYPILIGLSFGGIMAVEVGKLTKTEKIILIASAKTKWEIAWYYRLIGKTKIHQIIPASVLKRANFISNWFFGTESKKDKTLLANILHDTNPVFLKWAIDRILKWENTIIHFNLKHIHGKKDRILPLKFISADVIIENGGHLMTINKVAELDFEIKKLLA